MPNEIGCQQPCNEHGTICLKIEMLEKSIDELKSRMGSFATKEDFKRQVGFIESEIKDLKVDSEKHYNDNSNLQQMLARLDEFTKSLKESLAQNQKATEQLMEKIDKMYELMVNFKQLGGSENEAKNEIKIINDSNNKTQPSPTPVSDVNSAHKALEFVKDYGTIILILVALVVYLITGHWPLPSWTTATH